MRGKLCVFRFDCGVVGVGYGLEACRGWGCIWPVLISKHERCDGLCEAGEAGCGSWDFGDDAFHGQSIGLALLEAVMAATLPTQTLLAVFAGLTVQGGLGVSEFVVGMRDFFLIVTGIGAIGTLASTTRGQENTSNAGD